MFVGGLSLSAGSLVAGLVLYLALPDAAAAPWLLSLGLLALMATPLIRVLVSLVGVHPDAGVVLRPDDHCRDHRAVGDRDLRAAPTLTRAHESVRCHADSRAGATVLSTLMRSSISLRR